MITNIPGVFIPEGTASSVVKNADGTLAYVDYIVGDSIYRVTVTRPEPLKTNYSTPTLVV